MLAAAVRSDGLHGQARRTASPGGHGAVGKPGKHHRYDCKKAHAAKIGTSHEEAKQLFADIAHAAVRAVGFRFHDDDLVTKSSQVWLIADATIVGGTEC